MYYHGARYYNPRASIWYGLDPLAEKMPSWSPYAYTFDNPIRYIDPTGMKPDDWYQNKMTGNYEWRDTNKAIKGYRYIGKSESIGAFGNGSERMYYLHANGSATEKTGNGKMTLSHAEGGKSIRMVSGTTITTSQTSVSGMAAQISYTHKLVGPVAATGSVGYVVDSYGGAFGGKFYYSYGFAVANSSGFSVDFNTIKATNPETLFKVDDFKGFGNSFTTGFGGGFSWGGSSLTAKADGVDISRSQEWGSYSGGYSTFGFSYGLSKPVFGVSLSRTETRFVKDIPKDVNKSLKR